MRARSGVEGLVLAVGSGDQVQLLIEGTDRSSWTTTEGMVVLQRWMKTCPSCGGAAPA